MTINAQNIGLFERIEDGLSTLWYAEANAADVATVKSAVLANDTKLSEVAGLTAAGAVATEGFTMAENVSEGEVYNALEADSVARGKSTIAPTIVFSLLEGVTANSQRLVFRNVEADSNGNVERISGFGSPTNKFFVMEYRIKNNRIRVVLPEVEFISRGDIIIGAEELESYEVTYGISSDSDGDDFVKLTGELYAAEPAE